jgi:hypothetical protein
MEEYYLKIVERESYLFATVSGEERLEAALAYWQEILETCKRLNYNKIIIEENLQGTASMVDYYKFGKALSTMTQGLGLKIAFIDRNADHEQKNIFAETVAINRGLNAKLCTRIEEAENWLSS